MKAVISYHTHTKWSDGAASPAEMLQEARRIGLSEIGFSDHLFIHPRITNLTWTMTPEAVEPYTREILALTRDSSTPKVRLGLEVDYIPETTGRLSGILGSFPFDFVIGSIHYTREFPVDMNARLWDSISESEQTEIWRAYWVGIKELASTGLFDIVGHLDLPKKFGHRSAIELTGEIDAALDAIASAGMAIELNTSGWSYPAAEAYPSPALLKATLNREIPVLISADAHQPAHLTRDFERASILLRDIGFQKTVRFQKREMFPVPLLPFVSL